MKYFAGVWFYVVQLEPPNPRAPHLGGPMEPVKVAVLMDGTTVVGVKQYDD
jgi:hypothetical protein